MRVRRRSPAKRSSRRLGTAFLPNKPGEGVGPKDRAQPKLHREVAQTVKIGVCCGVWGNLPWKAAYLLVGRPR